MRFEDVEHLAILLGVVATAFGLLKGLRGWQRARDEAIIARSKQQETIEEIAAEFKPRNGRTLAEVVADVDASVKDHHRKADVWFTDNNEAHKEIHRRIDGLFEMLGGSTNPRKTAERHHCREEEVNG